MIKLSNQMEFSTKTDPGTPQNGGAGIDARDPHTLYNKNITLPKNAEIGVDIALSDSTCILEELQILKNKKIIDHFHYFHKI